MGYYVLNSAVITGPGSYTYELVDVETARKWLALFESHIESRIGYEATQRYIEKTLGLWLPISREQHYLEPGDEALVVRLRYRLADPSLKVGNKLQPGDQDWELGILRREA